MYYSPKLCKSSFLIGLCLLMPGLSLNAKPVEALRTDLHERVITFQSIPDHYANPPKTLSDSPVMKKYRTMARHRNYYGLVESFEEQYPDPLVAPDQPFGIYLRALGYVGEWRKGVQLSKEYLENNPGDPEVLYHLLTLREQYGELTWDDCKEVLELINRMEPASETERAVYHFALGQMYHYSGDKGGNSIEKESGRKALSHFYRASQLNPLLRLNPERLAKLPNFIISTLYLLKRKNASNFLIRHFLVTRDDLVRSRAIAMTTTFYSWPDTGLTKEEKQLRKHLVTRYKKVENKIYSRKGLKELSVNDFEVILKNSDSKKYFHKNSPIYLKTLYKLGYYHLKQGEYDNALKAYRRILDVTPNYGQIHANLGVIYSNKGDTEKALNAFEKDLRNNWMNENRSGQRHWNLINRSVKAGQTSRAKRWARDYPSYLEREKGYLNQEQIRRNLRILMKLSGFTNNNRLDLNQRELNENINYLQKRIKDRTGQYFKNYIQRSLRNDKVGRAEEWAEIYLDYVQRERQFLNGDQVRQNLRVHQGLYELSKNERWNISQKKVKNSMKNLRRLLKLGEQLVKAASKGQVTRVKDLIDTGVNVDLKFKGATALIAASEEGHKEIAKILLEAGANPEIELSSGRTARHIASMRDHDGIVKLLQDQKTGKDSARDLDQELIEASAKEDLRQVIRLLDKGASVHAGDESRGRTALIQASKAGHFRVVKELLYAGADINARSKIGNTALIHAVKEGNRRIARLLIDLGANANASNRKDATALVIATSKGDLKMVKRLVEVGANISAEDWRGNTVLMVAAGTGNVDLVNFYLEHGANPNKKNQGGQTPLTIAVMEGHNRGAERLIAAGANLNVKDMDHKTPLDYAAEEGHEEIAELLKDQGAKKSAELETIQASKESNILDTLSDKHRREARKFLKAFARTLPDGKAVTDFDSPALMAASKFGNAETVKALIEAGANVNVKDDNGMTPLMLASQNGHLETATVLIEAGALMSVENKEGMTALELAEQEENEEVMKLLKKHATKE